MLEFTDRKEFSWSPPAITEDIIKRCRNETNAIEYAEKGYLAIFRTEPYIDSIYIPLSDEQASGAVFTKRFTFHEGYQWSYDDEKFFVEYCLKNPKCGYTPQAIQSIYEYYSEKYPDWKLKRYFTVAMRLLDHIYHCMRKNSVKEMLYKAGLDELAVNTESIDEINLLSSKPSDIYDGISMRTLRALNCEEGSRLLMTTEKRAFVKQLQVSFPDIFNGILNDAQCGYLNYLIEGELTVGEVGRLFQARRMDLRMIWNPNQYDLFIWKETINEQSEKAARELGKIDPIYKKYITRLRETNLLECQRRTAILRKCLLLRREEYDRQFRQSNRKRDPNWQERDSGYVVRYPQTINDFCREAAYMCNCLLAYVDAVLCNDTTILFMRKTDSYNEPFITIEIFGSNLMQAYHRFNEECTREEAVWIRDYCTRHGIAVGEFVFD
jgi:hypothetical protein